MSLQSTSNARWRAGAGTPRLLRAASRYARTVRTGGAMTHRVTDVGACLTARLVIAVRWQDPKEASMGKRLRCRLGMHTWTQKHTEDNRPYRVCLHCGAEDIRGEGRRPGLPEVGGG